MTKITDLCVPHGFDFESTLSEFLAPAWLGSRGLL